MIGRFLLTPKQVFVEGNIYANRSSLILDWLLCVGIERKAFSIREVAREIGVSIGLVQKILAALALQGVLKTSGLRTAKRFSLQRPLLLLNGWINQYHIVKKCKLWTYRSHLGNRAELLEALKQTGLQKKVVLALHSATEMHKCKCTNLSTTELYLMDPSLRPKVEKALQLEHQEHGYEVLLIEPYYTGLLARTGTSDMPLRVSSPLLTFLDLFHFPLRGREQAEYMAQKIPELRRIQR